jgi:hypothetical protein
MDEARAESEAPADLMEMVVGGRREEEVLEATDDDITALLEQLRVRGAVGFHACQGAVSVLTLLRRASPPHHHRSSRRTRRR